jgi:hypothetical protein
MSELLGMIKQTKLIVLVYYKDNVTLIVTKQEL